MFSQAAGDRGPDALPGASAPGHPSPGEVDASTPLIGSRGGMAVVYGATHRNGKRVGDQDPPRRALARRGDPAALLARGIRRQRHPARYGAVSVLDDDVAPDGSAFIVMELLDQARPSRPAGRREASAARSRRGPDDRRRAARRPRLGARQERRPPRHQAGERLHHEGGRREGARLRHRQGLRGASARLARPARKQGPSARNCWLVHGCRSRRWRGGIASTEGPTSGPWAPCSSPCSREGTCTTHPRTRSN